MRLSVSILALATLLAVACKRDSGSSVNFDDAGEDAQQALASEINFTLTERVFERWQRAQENLERLPPQELNAASDPGGSDPVMRGITRLESSPPARKAIESAGLTVKQFVLATVALAQAVRASQGGVPPNVGTIAANVRFVMAHASRLSNRGAGSVWVPPAELSEEELAAQQAWAMDSAAQESDTGNISVQPRAPVFQNETSSEPSRVPVNPPEQPKRDTSSNDSGTTPEPTKTDSITSRVR